MVKSRKLKIGQRRLLSQKRQQKREKIKAEEELEASSSHDREFASDSSDESVALTSPSPQAELLEDIVSTEVSPSNNVALEASITVQQVRESKKIVLPYEDMYLVPIAIVAPQENKKKIEKNKKTVPVKTLKPKPEKLNQLMCDRMTKSVTEWLMTDTIGWNGNCDASLIASAQRFANSDEDIPTYKMKLINDIDQQSFDPRDEHSPPLIKDAALKNQKTTADKKLLLSSNTVSKRLSLQKEEIYKTPTTRSDLTLKSVQKQLETEKSCLERYELDIRQNTEDFENEVKQKMEETNQIMSFYKAELSNLRDKISASRLTYTSTEEKCNLLQNQIKAIEESFESAEAEQEKMQKKMFEKGADAANVEWAAEVLEERKKEVRIVEQKDLEKYIREEKKRLRTWKQAKLQANYSDYCEKIHQVEKHCSKQKLINLG
ncbi:hypothetical protein Ciccas_001993 [Cichlidogyrus casuarinus]|uniref:Uncharacterized protein n=1 Tax=Cichlidogyrus casuarinus TaxID=1844966 RepID=A0ABD2QII2_9PLAT